MKLPFLDLYVLRTNTLRKQLENAEAEGKNHSNRQVSRLLRENHRLSLLAGGGLPERLKKKGLISVSKKEKRR